MEKEEYSDDKMLDASPELVAYHLLLHIMENEHRPLTGPRAATAKVNRQFVFNTYAICLEAVRGQRPLKARRPTDKVTWKLAGNSSATKD